MFYLVDDGRDLFGLDSDGEGTLVDDGGLPGGDLLPDEHMGVAEGVARCIFMKSTNIMSESDSLLRPFVIYKYSIYVFLWKVQIFVHFFIGSIN